MMRALWAGASGMRAEQINMDVTANNLANVNTIGYKKSRADMQDLVYQTYRQPGTPVAQGAQVPTGIQVGIGTRVAAIQKIHAPGALSETGNKLDVAIANGDGFWQVLLPDGQIGYTRDGTFKKSADGKLVTSDGYILQPEIAIPEDAVDITITEVGAVFVMLAGQMEPAEIGSMELVKFVNPAGLSSIGRNLYVETAASGAPYTGTPGNEGFGQIAQGVIELSNVNVVDEMVHMITLQRAYELSSKAIQTADQMLGIASSLKR
ncbi:flagellar basal-body rod protein FlgG [bacterium]|nr:flagellar basal-body rod protein FlgG [bacterium]MBU1615256.1 flagellar basal-body rod protein FlgG [bacterium]